MHAVVRTDNMTGTDVRSQLVSVKYIVDGKSTEIDNGNVLKLDGLMTNEREIFKGVAPTASTAINDIVLIASPEVMYDSLKRSLEEFYNDGTRACRGYRLHSGDIFSVTKDALDGAATPAVGNIVELKAGTKLNVAATATASSTTIGKIIAVETAGKFTYYVIKVD